MISHEQIALNAKIVSHRNVIERIDEPASINRMMAEIFSIEGEVPDYATSVDAVIGLAKAVLPEGRAYHVISRAVKRVAREEHAHIRVKVRIDGLARHACVVILDEILGEREDR